MNIVQENRDIRKAMRIAGVSQWRVAERYGLCEANFSRLLRRELPEDKKQKILGIIAELEAESE